jgi:hypothetical protein
VISVPGERDEFDDYLIEQMRDPVFLAAYRAVLRHLDRGRPGRLAVDGHEYQRRLRNRRRR